MGGELTKVSRFIIILPSYWALYLYELYYLPWYFRVVEDIDWGTFSDSLTRTSLYFLICYFIASIIKLSDAYTLPTLLITFYIYVPTLGIYAWPYMLVSLIQPVLRSDILFLCIVIGLLEKVISVIINKFLKDST
jgi:hypothetical protein